MWYEGTRRRFSQVSLPKRDPCLLSGVMGGMRMGCTMRSSAVGPLAVLIPAKQKCA